MVCGEGAHLKCKLLQTGTVALNSGRERSIAGEAPVKDGALVDGNRMWSGLQGGKVSKCVRAQSTSERVHFKSDQDDWAKECAHSTRDTKEARPGEHNVEKAPRCARYASQRSQIARHDFIERVSKIER